MSDSDEAITFEAEPGTGYVTADGVAITDGLVVWDYDLDLSQVSFSGTPTLRSPYFAGWFSLWTVDNARRKLMNGERMTTRHPFTGQLSADAAAKGRAE